MLSGHLLKHDVTLKYFHCRTPVVHPQCPVWRWRYDNIVTSSYKVPLYRVLNAIIYCVLFLIYRLYLRTRGTMIHRLDAATHSTVALSRRDRGATLVTRFVHSKWRGLSLPLFKQHPSTTTSSFNEIPRFNESLDYHKIHGATMYTRHEAFASTRQTPC
ncbi:uncharacterized protein BO87DRAFT_185440 [Aspergillus neoniger CBS 115656]|uniref:Uncharacterized protein n=1 Tax=Aspergillus neoniger (strain CBS 115656) TaxID=1448310 RepID=A0A318YTJ1_ASPNB|nr:hypothetical protein BO87DRAFT_185440 [Aspergillus neoniger CBS 115656]PYH37746.1 hypothetical protein BO87DRAFT_185440 [Aspergillus neoniger CBS 115656]